MKEEVKDKENQHLSSDEHIKHLLTIHFTLIILCFALLSAWYLSRESEVKKAQKQLEEVNNVVNKWQRNWLDLYATTLVNQYHSQAPGPPVKDWWIPAGINRPRIHVKLREPFWTLKPVPSSLQEFIPNPTTGCRENGQLSNEAPVIPESVASVTICRPANLAEFEKLWNGLQAKLHVYHAINVFSTAYVSYPSRTNGTTTEVSTTNAEMSSNNNSASATDATPDFTDYATAFNKALGGDTDFTHVFYGAWFPGEDSFHNYPVWIPASIGEVEAEQFNGQIALAQFYKVEWNSGPFDRAFPELEKITKNTRDLPFDRLFAIVQAEAERSGEKVEIFGAKFPTEELARWGAVAILLVQLYLLININALKLRLNTNAAKSGIPWIGVYQDILAKTGTVISAFVFPTTVLVILVIHQARLVGSTLVWSLMLIGASTLLSFLSFRAIRCIWNLMISK